MLYRMAAFVILVILTSTSHCYSQWNGRPWNENTNAINWRYLQDEYQPFEQIFHALVERADAVRATVNTNYPFLKYTNTWTIYYGSVTNEIASNDTVVVSGFPQEAVNGIYQIDGSKYQKDYEYELSEYWLGSGWAIGPYNYFFDAIYQSDTGPESDSWYIVEDPTNTVDGATIYGEPRTEVVPLSTNVISTNAFAPFEVEVGGQTITGTPRLGWESLEWVDQQIENLSAHYVPLLDPTNRLGVTNLFYWSESWDASGELSLIGNAGVGRTETGTYITVSGTTNEFESTRYTRQPDVAQNWLLAEYVYDGSNWVQTANNGLDFWLPTTYTNGPFVDYIAVTGGVGSATVTLSGQVAKAWYWYDSELASNAVEVVDTGNFSTNQWHSFEAEIAGTGATGDYISIYYEGPITLYGERPRRLYAIDLEERAAVIDRLRYLPVVHNWAQGYEPNTNTYYPETTNLLYNSFDTFHYVESDFLGTNGMAYLPFYDLLPISSTADFAPPMNQNLFFLPLLEYALGIETFAFGDQFQDLNNNWLLSSVTNYKTRINAVVRHNTGELVFDVNYMTNSMQGTNVPLSVKVTTLATVGVESPTKYQVPIFEDSNIIKYDASLERYVLTATNTVTLAGGINTITSGVLGFDTLPQYPPTNMPRQNIGDSVVPNPTGSNWYEVIPFVEYEDTPGNIPEWYRPAASAEYGVTTYRGSALRYFIPFGATWGTSGKESGLSPDYSMRVDWYYPSSPIPSVLDWGVTNGFLYR